MRNFSVTVQVNELYELSWKQATKEFSQRDGSYDSYENKEKTFITEKEARDYAMSLLKADNFELVRITKLDI